MADLLSLLTGAGVAAGSAKLKTCNGTRFNNNLCNFLPLTLILREASVCNSFYRSIKGIFNQLFFVVVLAYRLIVLDGLINIFKLSTL